jgi:ubiquitin carboxyl-terminal hydrolase 34
MKTLKDSLDKFISDENISDYKCDACKKNVSIIKRNSIAELPNVLIVHLQRIGFNYDTFQNDKVNSRLEFPKQLNLKNYTSEVLCGQNNGQEKIPQKEEIKEESKSNNAEKKEEEFQFYTKEDAYYDYELVGVVVHTGTADAGHYYSYINVKREGENDEMQFDNKEDMGKWVEFNDSMIRGFNINNLEDECFGGKQQFSSSSTAIECSENTGWISRPVQYEEKENIRSAYMLLYERKKKKPIKIVVNVKSEEKTSK